MAVTEGCGESDASKRGTRSNEGAETQGKRGWGGRSRNPRGKSTSSLPLSVSPSAAAGARAAGAAAPPSSRHFTSSAHHAAHVLRALFIVSLLLAPPTGPWLLSPSPAETLPRYSLTASADNPLPIFLDESPQYGMVDEFVTNMHGFAEEMNWTRSNKDCRDWQWRETAGLICDSSGNVTAIFITELSYALPSVLYQLTNLERLSLTWTPNTDPNLSPAIADLTRLTSLSLTRAQLGTTIPSVLFTLTALNTLSLRDVGLTSAIAPEFSKLNRLIDLDLYYNLLAGPVPTALCIPALKFLALSVNLFTSIHTAVSVMKSLKSLSAGYVAKDASCV